jgi:hypothetical protein
MCAFLALCPGKRTLIRTFRVISLPAGQNSVRLCRNSQFQKTYFTIKEPYQAAIPGVFHGALYEKARVAP